MFLGLCISQSDAINNIKNSIALLSSDHIIYVGGSGEGNYTSIQDAIDNASKGDTVFVYNGKYNEKVFVNKQINLIGEDNEKTIIDINESSDVIKIFKDWVNISGFLIRSNSSDSKGLVVNSNYVTIYNNNISSNNKISQ